MVIVIETKKEEKRLFYSDPKRSWRILDIFYVERKGREISEKDRVHTALSYRLEGNSLFSTEKGEYKANSASVVYIPEGLDYRRITKSSEKLIVLHLKCEGEGDDRIEIRNNASALESLFRKMYEVWESGESFSYNRCMALLYRTFEELERSEAEGLAAVPAVIEPGVEEMMQHFRDPNLTVATLAEKCFVSEVYFRRLFHHHFGISPLQKILELRFHHACRLLRAGYYTVQKAALLSGFSEVKYFRTAFKKRFGISPTAYAKEKGFPVAKNN